MRRGRKKKVEKSSKEVTITHLVPGKVFLGEGAPVLLSIVRLKQGLQEGIGKEWLRWESPKVQEMMSDGRSCRRRTRMRQGSKVMVEASIVALSRDQPNFDSGSETEGAKRERGNESKSSFLRLLFRKQVMTTEMMAKTVRGMRE